MSDITKEPITSEEEDMKAFLEICPYCEQGNVIYARIKDNSHIYRFCPECDTIWHDKIDDKSGQGLKSFLESKGYDYPSDQIEIIDELQ